MRLNERQKQMLKRLDRESTTMTSGSAISPDIAKQLQAKGLIDIYHDWSRYEWGRKVATLKVVGLTKAGKAVAEALKALAGTLQAPAAERA